MRSQLRQHPNPKSNAARKGSNLHAEPTSTLPKPPTPGATEHERGQTFMRSQILQHPTGSNLHAKPTSPTSQPPELRGTKGLKPSCEADFAKPPEQRSTKGVKPSCEANFPNTSTPGATQHERGQTFMRSQLSQHPNPRSNAE